MRPQRIFLIRHGESEGNKNNARYHDTPDFALKLTPTGVEQARNAGLTLRAQLADEGVHVYLSPLHRTRETFAAIRDAIDSNITKAVEDPRIREQDWGHLRHPDDNRIVRKQRDAFSPFYFRIPNGESGADVYDRVSGFLDTLHRDFEKPDYPPNALIVSHGLAIRLFLMRWFHWTVEEFEQLRNPSNCQIITLQKEPDQRYRLAGEIARY